MTVPAVLALDGVIRRYAWGSPTAIPRLLGLEPDGRLAAELWLGAHPDDPSAVPAHDTTLDKLIADDPEVMLGAPVVEQFGARLPFLLKILAAGGALSIQVHPTIAQARTGFDAEDALGIPRDAPNRNYRDRNHKPELLCALTPFDALCGFRPVEDTLRLLDALDVATLAPIRALLTEPDGLRHAFTALLTHAAPGPLVAAVVARAAALEDHPEWADAARAVAMAAADFPGDVGVALSLLLNVVSLAPGEAIYLGAGNVHAYLRGTGVEIMANSDNVLRCGLTAKHVDVGELLKITDFTPLAEPRCPTTVDGTGSYGFATPVPDFALSVVDVDGYKGSVALGGHGPHIVLCTSGGVEVSALGSTVTLTPGHAAFVAAREAAFTVRGTGQVFAAAVQVP